MAVVVSGSFSPSPAARACSDLKADVARYVGATNAARALAEAENCIGTAVAKLNTKLWNWAIVYQDITLVAGTSDYDLAAPFKAPRKAELLNGSGTPLSRLTYLDPHSFSDEYYDRNTQGSPQVYTVENPHEYGQVNLSSPPHSSFVSQYPTLRLRYYQKVQPCSGSVTSLDIPHETAEWVSWYAKSLLAAARDPQKFSVADQTQRDLWRGLISSKVADELSDWS